MSMLRSAVDELRSEELSLVESGALGDDLVEIRIQLTALESEWLRRVGAFERRRGFEADGHLSMTGWLKDRCRLASGEASERVRVARSLMRMPETARAFQAGVIDYRRVRELVHARRAHREVFARDETVLVDAAESLSVRELRRAVAYWRQAADHDAAMRDADAKFKRRRLHVSEAFEGMVRIDGDLDPESGQIVITALRAHTESAALDASDDRSPAQQRADALTDICRDYLDHGDTPVSGGEKPHFTVTVDLAVLESRASGRSEYEDGTVIDAETARRLVCDAGVSRVITRGASEPLDVGRRTRTIPAAIRRALVIRDGGCTWGGCDRPARWCDAHHIKHWIDGGPTSLENLKLLCRRHHRMTHAREAAGRSPPGDRTPDQSHRPRSAGTGQRRIVSAVIHDDRGRAAPPHIPG